MILRGQNAVRNLWLYFLLDNTKMAAEVNYLWLKSKVHIMTLYIVQSCWNFLPKSHTPILFHLTCKCKIGMTVCSTSIQGPSIIIYSALTTWNPPPFLHVAFGIEAKFLRISNSWRAGIWITPVSLRWIPFKVRAISCKNYLLKIYSQHANFLNAI